MVKDTDRLRVRFGEPRSGWLPLELQAGDQRFAETMSYTPHDSLDELVTWLLGLCAGTPTGAVRWNTEPVGCTFVATPVLAEQVRFDVRRHDPSRREVAPAVRVVISWGR